MLILVFHALVVMVAERQGEQLANVLKMVDIVSQNILRLQHAHQWDPRQYLDLVPQINYAVHDYYASFQQDCGSCDYSTSNYFLNSHYIAWTEY